MGKNKKKQDRRQAAGERIPSPESGDPVPSAPGSDSAPETPAARALTQEGSATPAPPVPASDARTRHRLGRLMPDLCKVLLAAVVIVLAAFIWYQPPLIVATRP